MFRIALINLPFASVNYPSIGLAKLRTRLQDEFGDEVEIKIYHLNHHFRKYFGNEFYEKVSHSINSTISGLGDWMFSHIVYPELGDNVDEYFQRYPSILQEFDTTPEFFIRIRSGVDALLEQLISRYQPHQYDAVGFTSMFQQTMASIAMAKQLKKLNPKIITFMGGANCEASMGVVLVRNVDSVDYVFSGPALESLPKVIRYLINGQRKLCDNVKGVFTKKKVQNKLSNINNEIGDLLDIDSELSLDYDDYFESIEEVCPDVMTSILFETSHGCWWGQKYQCTFCGENPTLLNYWSMTPNNAINQFDQILRYYPRTKQFLSVDLILPRNYITEVLPYINIPSDACVLYEVRPDLNEKELTRLVESGISRVQVGIESLSTNTLKLIKKGSTGPKNISFLKYCLTHQIEVDWNFLVGFPGETEEPYIKYIDMLPKLFHLPPPSGVFPIHFDRFSPYFYSQDEYKLNLQPYDFYRMIYPFSQQDIKDFAYYFNDQNYNKECYMAVAKWISPLRRLVGQWRSLWSSAQADDIPILSYDIQDSRKVIIDSREGSTITHTITPLEATVLEHLQTPKTIRQLQSMIANKSTTEIETYLNLLYDRGLLFEDNGLYVSLVVNSDFEQGFI